LEGKKLYLKTNEKMPFAVTSGKPPSSARNIGAKKLGSFSRKFFTRVFGVSTPATIARN
jgi:hypothetical protein